METKRDLRNVLYEDYQTTEEFYDCIDDPKKKPKWIKGIFHQWGADVEGTTIGIIENQKSGQIYTILPQKIKFID